MIQVIINGEDRTGSIQWDSLKVEQNLTKQVDSASFIVKKRAISEFTPAISDEVYIYSATKIIFGGEVISIDEKVDSPFGVVFSVQCVDWTRKFDGKLVAESYEDKTIYEIIEHIVQNYAPDFSYDNVC